MKSGIYDPERFRKLMKVYGLGVNDLHDKTGVSVRTIRRLLAGEDVTPGTAAKLAKGFGPGVEVRSFVDPDALGDLG